jgi:putative addiction module component (TIGR02574 family)
MHLKESDMTTSLELVEAEAMKLPEEQRLLLAERLFQSTTADIPLAPEWEAEIARRIAEIDAGTVQAIPMEQVMANLRRKHGA